MTDDWLVDVLTAIEAHASENGLSHLFPLLENAFEAAARELNTNKRIPGRVLAFHRPEIGVVEASNGQPSGDVVAFHLRRKLN
ncbi:hypothetical protein [Rhodobacter ferrooxidans]|uniref:hypothetical protein n=1 Tax=Rhodobacter ferrooxidans TaxID=371731 RepID=UPI0012E9CCE9|nr:hypothetical protein [Rhodobacter sp. SW2]